MLLKDFLLYLAIGRLIIWLLQVNGLLRPVWDAHRLLTELKECDLCLGFWIYLGLGAGLKQSFGPWPFLISIIILAALATFTAHLLRLGWQSKFGITVID